MTNDDKDLKCPDYVESAFRKWFEYSPCFICGYKGGGYYQIKDHPCAEHYHNRTLSKLWDMDGNPIQHSLSGVPQQPSEPLKELEEQAVSDELQLRYFKLMYPDVTESDAEIVANSLSKAIVSKFGQPSEKKALSLEDMKKIMWDLENKLGYQPAYETIAQAIHSALPARKDVKWPEKMEEERFYCEDGDIYRGREWNQAIDEFKKLNGG